MEKEFYDYGDIVTSKKLAILGDPDGMGMVYVHYVDDDGTKVLFRTDGDVADGLVERWNEAIEEAKEAEKHLKYLSGIWDKINKEVDEKDHRISHLEAVLKGKGIEYLDTPELRQGFICPSCLTVVRLR